MPEYNFTTIYYLKCPVFNKDYKTCKDTRKRDPYVWKRNTAIQERCFYISLEFSMNVKSILIRCIW